MAYQQNDNSGSLFRNEKKVAPNQPDYEGSATINGTYMRIAAWIKTSKEGRTYMSLAFNEPQPVRQPYTPPTERQPVPSTSRPASAPAPIVNDDSDLPFD